jgi:hypothetical protein
MGHYARVVNGMVVEVIVAKRDFIDTLPNAFQYVKTSYNTRGGVHYLPDSNEPSGGEALRKNYAGIGYNYDETRDAFIPPRPYGSWKLNEDTCLWDAPIPYPEDGKRYIWNEDQVEWTLMDNEYLQP